MCSVNKFNEEIAITLVKYKNKNAIIYCDENKFVETLQYGDIERIGYVFYENLKYLINKSICFGLVMDHNILIPPLIISLQKLKCTFIFLDQDQINSEILLSKLNIQYIIVYNKQCFQKSNFLFSVIIDFCKVCDIYFSENQSSIYENINYIVQTSGTTSTQKIVKVEHQCIVSNVFCLRNRLHLTHEDIIYFGTSLTFDPSMIELYLALVTGASLLIVSKRIQQSPFLLYNTLFKNSTICITFLQMCPSVFLQWSLMDIENIFQKSNLRFLLLGGENFPNMLKTLKKSTQLKVFSVYGITELSCWAMLEEVTNEKEVSLGTVLDDTIFEVRNENGEIITEGEGELYIGSYSRICYLDNEQPENINKPLLRRTGDQVVIKENIIIYKGRCDDIIKRFGHRVDLLYIENVIHTSTGLRNICIWSENKHKLTLFVLISEKNELIFTKIVDKFRIKLLHLLPKECMPDNIELLQTLPLTKNGKVNKKKLLLKADCLLEKTCPSNKHLINLFIDLWYKYLRNNNLKILKEKTFYELGGTSIVRIQFTEELKQNFYGTLPPHFFDYIFTNTYNDICKFIQDFQYCNNKRTRIEENIRKNKIIKHNVLATMNIRWAYNLQACVDSTPVVILNKRFAIAGSFSNILAVLNVDSGKEVTKVVLPNAIENSCCISECEEFIYVGCYDHNMYCIEILSGKIIWSYKTGDCIKNRPCLLNKNSIVFGSYDKFLYCVNTKTGLKNWKLHVGAGVTSDILLNDNKLIVAIIKGVCMCLDDYGKILWQVQFECPIFGAPTQLKNGFVIPDVLGSIHYFSLSGEKLWSFKVKGNIYSSILSYENYFVFGTHDAILYFFEFEMDTLEPKLKQKIYLDSAISSTPSLLVHSGKKYVVQACTSGYVYLINSDSLSIESRVKLDDDVFSSPAVIENKILIGCRDNNLICIEVTKKI